VSEREQKNGGRGEEVRPLLKYGQSQGLLSIYQRVKREYILLSDKVTPGTPFYVHPFQKGVHPPVRYPQELISIYQRVRREYIQYICFSDKVTLNYPRTPFFVHQSQKGVHSC
jgi:hypothetical protein